MAVLLPWLSPSPLGPKSAMLPRTPLLTQVPRHGKFRTESPGTAERKSSHTRSAVFLREGLTAFHEHSFTCRSRK